LIRYSRACGSYQDFLDRGLLLTGSYWSKGSSWLSWSHHLRSLPWLRWPIWNIYVTNDHGYVPRVVSTSSSFPHSWLITGIVTKSARLVPLVEHETLTEYLSSPPVFSGVRIILSLALCVCFVDCCLSFRPFSVGHCFVCSSFYAFSLPVWYLQTLLCIYLRPLISCWYVGIYDV
jgi:hypothetical protein